MGFQQVRSGPVRSTSYFLYLHMAVQILTGQIQKTRVLVHARKMAPKRMI
jgi:hypothetical protein